MRAEPRSVNCPSCGAGQSVLGGGRVTTFICAFCGTPMDAAGDFEAMGAQASLTWPETPFRIGMEGEIDGVQVTVIGVLGMVERHQGERWDWVEHQLFSPTHGYAWLTWEDGWCVFTRKTRALGAPPVHSAISLNAMENPPRLSFEGEGFRYYESGVAEITFAAGAFAFRPEIGQTRYVVSYLGPDRMVHVGRSVADGGDHQADGEVETEISTLIDRDTALARFGVDPAEAGPPPRGVHPLQPFVRSPALLDMRNLALGTAVLALIAALYLSSGRGQTLAETRWAAIDAPQQVTVDVTDAERLVAVVVHANVRNSWAWFDVEVTGGADETVFEVSRGVEYYFGRDSDGSWTEGSQEDWIYFRPPAPGAYTVTATLAESGVWRAGAPATEARLSVMQGLTSGVPAFLLAGLCALVAAGLLVQRWLHHKRRWSGSDWSD